MWVENHLAGELGRLFPDHLIAYFCMECDESEGPVHVPPSQIDALHAAGFTDLQIVQAVAVAIMAAGVGLDLDEIVAQITASPKGEIADKFREALAQAAVAVMTASARN